MKIKVRYIKIVIVTYILIVLSNHVTAKSYYIDSIKGNDASEGSINFPWKTLIEVNKHEFTAGDTIFFHRGSKFNGNLYLPYSGTKENPIILTAYGKGEAPAFTYPEFSLKTMSRAFEITGSNIIIEGLYFHDFPVPPANILLEKRNKLVPQMGAVFIHKGANNNIVSNCEFYKCPIGIRVRGDHCRISNNYLHDADSITYNWGSIAIVVVGAHNEVSYNKIYNYGYYGGKFGLDGAAIELDREDNCYTANDTYIHHNISINTKGGFMEITGATTNVKVEYNVSDDIDKFVGTVSVKGIEIKNNTIVRIKTPEMDQVVFWQLDGKEKSEYHIENNLIYINKNVYVYDTPYRNWGIKEQPRKNNLYFCKNKAAKDLIGVAMEPSDVIANPMFVDIEKGNYCLNAGSLARERGIGAYYQLEPDWRAGLINETARQVKSNIHK